MKTKQLKKYDSFKRKITKHYKFYVDASGDSTEASVKLGNLFVELKEKITADGKIAWIDYYNENIPRPTIRTAQRLMELATHADIKKYPNLKWCNKSQLKKLTNLSDKKEVGAFLESNGIQLDFKDDEYAPVYKFQKEIKKLIEKKRQPNVTRLNTEENISFRKQYYFQIKDKNKKIERGTFKFSQKGLKNDKLMLKELSAYIKRCDKHFS